MVSEAHYYSFGLPGFMELLVIGAILLMSIVFTVLPFWLIFRKAGFDGALSVLMLLPVVNVVMLFFLALADWPARRRNARESAVMDLA